MRGPLLMVAATASFTVMISLVKTARPSGFHTLELMGWRSLVAVPLLLLFSQAWRVRHRRVLAVRCMFGACAMFCFYSATEGLGVGELTVLFRLQPVWIALIAPLALGRQERVGPEIWSAAALGVVGTGILAWPKLGAAPIEVYGVLFALGSGVFSAMAHTALRALKEEDPRAVVFWFQVFVGVAVVVAMLLTDQPPRVPLTLEMPALLGIGACALLGQLLLTGAYASARAAKVATAGFAGPIFGFTLDGIVFGLVPGVHALVGTLFILVAGGLLLRRPAEEPA